VRSNSDMKSPIWEVYPKGIRSRDIFRDAEHFRKQA
jgi:hypothetical protein